MEGKFTAESFDSISADWKRIQENNPAGHIFSSLEWTEAWWRQFGNRDSLYLGSVRDGDTPIGIAPLLVADNSARFIGNVDTCDYLDFIIEPGNEALFFTTLLDHLIQHQVRSLDLAPLRPDSTVISYLAPLALERQYGVSYQKEDITLDMELPSSWEDYLQSLTGKQRHELKRKLRRLDEMGEIQYRTVTEYSEDAMQTFLTFFRESRDDKAAFLTVEMESFFKTIADIMARNGILQLNFLELNNAPIAATMCFDYKNTVYLYNSGYDPEYGWLSAGILSKALCIKDSIEKGKKKFDFLKGDEVYKYHLGGQELPLYRYTILLP
jgi:CelD/BcsL family acetyltransferase involved in cellulose biosynthesis